MTTPPLHIVMTGCDQTVFSLSTPSDTLLRLRDYAARLAALRPGSHLTYFALGAAPTTLPLSEPSLSITPLTGHPSRAALKLPAALSRLHANHPISLITTQTPFEEYWLSLLMGKWVAIPVLVQVHTDLINARLACPKTFRGWLQKLRYSMALSSLRCASAIRTVSKNLVASLQHYAGKAPLHNIPVPITMAQSALPRIEEKIPPTVLYVGRLSPEKNLALWLNIAAKVHSAIPEARFRLIGEGSERPKLERMIRELNLTDVATLEGAKAYNELSDVYRSSAVFLLTSTHESFGRVLLEAMMNGTPIVSTATSGPSELLNSSNAGLLFDEGDISGMSNAIITLLRNTEQRRTFSNNGEKFSQLFSPAHTSAEWVNLLHATATPPPNRVF